jgi:hypothetical protein
LHNWKKKIAVVLKRTFFATLPTLKQVPKDEADIAWFIYDLKLHAKEAVGLDNTVLQIVRSLPGRRPACKHSRILTDFTAAMNKSWRR